MDKIANIYKLEDDSNTCLEIVQIIMYILQSLFPPLRVHKFLT